MRQGFSQICYHCSKKREAAIMGLIETEETNKFNFEAFAAHAFYTEINRSLVREALAPIVIRHADAAFFCNAIHLIIDKLNAFRQMAAILAPGGILACNSAFYDGTNLEESFRFSRLWVRRAVGWLRKEHPEVRLSREAKATARQWLNPDEYISLLKQSGFSSVDVTEERVAMSLDSLRDLGHYWLFIEGALPGVPLAIGAEALGSTVYDVGHELNMAYLPRMWLQIVATKG